MKKPVKIKKARGGDLQQLVCPPVPQCFAPLGDRRLGSSEAESKKQLTKDHWNHSVLQGRGFPGLSSTFQDIPHKKRNEIFFKATFSKLTWLLYKRVGISDSGLMIHGHSADLWAEAANCNDIFDKQKPRTTLYTEQGKPNHQVLIAALNTICLGGPCSPTHCSQALCFAQVECGRVQASPSPCLYLALTRASGWFVVRFLWLLLRRQGVLQQLSHKGNESLCI